MQVFVSEAYRLDIFAITKFKAQSVQVEGLDKIYV